MSFFHLLPEQASTLAWQVDFVYFVLLAFSVLLTVGIAGTISVFVVRYRRSAHRHWQPPSTASITKAELAWISALFVISLVFFALGAKPFLLATVAPENAMEVFVVGRQWMWKTQHVTGEREIDELHVPVGQPVKLLMTSQDVIHSFYVPAFRVKQDVLPGRYTSIWFTATKPGVYHLFCAEYCGTQHSRMRGRIVVLSGDEYQAWVQGQNATVRPLVEQGAELFKTFGCAACHQNEAGTQAPILDGVFGTTVMLESGRNVVADESYLRESIVDPAGKVVAGYRSIMPSYAGRLSEEELAALVTYIKSMPLRDAVKRREP